MLRSALGCWLAAAALAGAQDRLLRPAAPDAFPRPAAAPPAGTKQVANVVARVDGYAILLQDLVAPLRPKLELMKQQLPPDQYRRQERIELKAQADRLIERAILVKEAESFVKEKKRLDAIRGLFEKDFQKFVGRIAKESKIRPEELPDQLAKEGTTLENLKREFIETNLAMGFLDEAVKSKVVDPSRAELLDYYRAHAGDFQRDAKAQWSAIEVKIGADPRAAAEKTHQASQRLQAGESFAAVAKALSDGPTAADGGKCPATGKGSYYDPAVDAALFSALIGVPSAPIRGKDAFHIVLVSERTADGAQPFGEVQPEIAKKLKDKQREVARKEKLAEMRKRHFVESVFDAVATQPDAPLQR